MRPLFAIIMLLPILACGPWIDADNCQVQASMVIAAIETDRPDMKTCLVYGMLYGRPHVEVKAFVNGRWQYAKLIGFSLSPEASLEHWQIVFYNDIQGFTPTEGQRCETGKK